MLHVIIVAQGVVLPALLMRLSVRLFPVLLFVLLSLVVTFDWNSGRRERANGVLSMILAGAQLPPSQPAASVSDPGSPANITARSGDPGLS